VGQGPEPVEAPKEGDVVKSQLPEAFLSPEGGKPPEPNPMEVDVPDPREDPNHSVPGVLHQ
jgi:hypothetical protein